MRWIGRIVVLLITLGWIATEIRGPQPPRCLLADTEWRRTSAGWEWPTWLGTQIPAREPALHPGVVGGFQLLVSIVALVAFSTRQPQRRPLLVSGNAVDWTVPSDAV